MDLKGLFRRAAGGNRDSLGTGAPPLVEREVMGEELAEVLAVRASIARVAEAREAHAAVVGQKAKLVQEAKQTEGELRYAQEQLAAREKLIAVAGGELPDEASPEEVEIARRQRHLRIRQERVHVFEDKARESQKELDARIGDMENSWTALGVATSDRLAADYRDAAAALRAAHLSYFALGVHFFHGWSSAIWRHWNKKLAIADPKRIGEFIIDPRPRALMPDQWPADVQKLQKDMAGLRAEIDEVKRSK